jgi:hypothetical protein
MKDQYKLVLLFRVSTSDYLKNGYFHYSTNVLSHILVFSRGLAFPRSLVRQDPQADLKLQANLTLYGKAQTYSIYDIKLKT